MARATADELTTDDGLPTREVPTAKGDVLVRGLSRYESLKLRDIPEGQREAHVIAMGMVDPPMTLEQVHKWQAVAVGGDFEPLATAIGELSGLLESSEKDAYKSAG